MYDVIFLMVYCVILGSVVGFLVGLFGIGGGLIIVFVFSVLLVLFNVVDLSYVLVIVIVILLVFIIFILIFLVFVYYCNVNVLW